ncbi:hypothetical protein T02_2199, partial [Trichinella nativa]
LFVKIHKVPVFFTADSLQLCMHVMQGLDFAVFPFGERFQLCNELFFRSQLQAQHARLMHGNPLLMAPCPGCRLQTVNFLGLLFNKRFDFGQLFFRHHQVDLFSLVFSTLFSYGGKLILQGPHGQL